MNFSAFRPSILVQCRYYRCFRLQKILQKTFSRRNVEDHLHNQPLEVPKNPSTASPPPPHKRRQIYQHNCRWSSLSSIVWYQSCLIFTFWSRFPHKMGFSTFFSSKCCSFANFNHTWRAVSSIQPFSLVWTELILRWHFSSCYLSITQNSTYYKQITQVQQSLTDMSYHKNSRIP